MNYEIPVTPGETYCIYCTSASATSGEASRLTVAYVYDGSGTSGTALINGQTVTTPRTFTPTQSTVTVSWRSTASGESGTGKINEPIVNKGTTPISPWKPYSNICPISGWTGVSGQHTGKQLLNPEYRTNQTSNIRYYMNNPLLLSAGTYTLSIKSQVNGMYVISNGITIFSKYNASALTFTLEKPTEVEFNFYKSGGIDSTLKCQLEVGDTATEYQQHQGETIPVSWETEAGTVYGGTLDLTTGVLTAEWSYVQKAWSEFTNQSSGDGYKEGRIYGLGILNETRSNTICDKLKYDSNGTNSSFYVSSSPSNTGYIRAFVPIETSDDETFSFAYPLAEPLVYQLDPVEIETLSGVNNVWSDGDEVTVSYLARKPRYSFASPLGTYNYQNLKLFGDTFITKRIG